MGWIFFDNSDSAEYDQGSLEGHLNYLKNWGGSPNFFDEFGGCLRDAFKQAEETGRELAVVEEGSWEIFGVVND